MKSLILLVFIVCVASVQAAPQMLLKDPLESPYGKYAANVQWDAAGYIGRIRMLVYGSGEKPIAVGELPQIKPSPANLTWISEDWFACESFVAESGASFCYMNVPRKRAYMIEIFAPKDDGDWLISYSSSAAKSNDSIQTISSGHSSLFPILLRDLPDSGLGYLSADFPILLSDAVDSFVEWRTKQGFKEMKFLSKVGENPKLGRLLIASFDEQVDMVYFPQGTTSTREMLALTKRKALPDDVQKMMNGINPPTLSIDWTDDKGGFHVLAHRDDQTTGPTELVAGRLEGISDSKYTGPGVSDLLGEKGKESSSGGGKSNVKITDSNKKSRSSKSSSGSGSSSSKKKPSRSK